MPRAGAARKGTIPQNGRARDAMPKTTYWFVFHEDMLLLRMKEDGEYHVPRCSAPPLPPPAARHRLGVHAGAPCVAYATRMPPEEPVWLAVGLRDAYGIIGEELYSAAGKAYQLIHWDRHSRYCSACGAETVPGAHISKKCPACGRENFPNPSVAVLALVMRKESALLVRAHTFRGKYFGLVAGFLEPGETLEECVRREVMEETGLAIRDIRYFGSRPWPYPNGLMAGFTAQYRGGEITLQKSELLDGGFFSRDAVPDLPQKPSLARHMIDWWLEGAGR
jgi:NAD+ diphosphatase